MAGFGASSSASSLLHDACTMRSERQDVSSWLSLFAGSLSIPVLPCFLWVWPGHRKKHAGRRTSRDPAHPSFCGLLCLCRVTIASSQPIATLLNMATAAGKLVNLPSPFVKPHAYGGRHSHAILKHTLGGNLPLATRSSQDTEPFPQGMRDLNCGPSRRIAASAPPRDTYRGKAGWLVLSGTT